MKRASFQLIACLLVSFNLSAQDCTDVTIVCDGGTWQSEISWEIVDQEGLLVLSGVAPFSGTACLSDDVCYDILMMDSYGDGWNGNTLVIGELEFGMDIGTEAQGMYGNCNYIIGCMDPFADNFDAEANTACAECCEYPLGYNCDQPLTMALLAILF